MYYISISQRQALHPRAQILLLIGDKNQIWLKRRKLMMMMMMMMNEKQMQKKQATIDKPDWRNQEFT
jgi:hypothetical protein